MVLALSDLTSKRAPQELITFLTHDLTTMQRAIDSVNYTVTDGRSPCYMKLIV